ncbi:hypothetical protein P7K49_012162 [Saguinus oedipus]|uniref:Uncharacterized protein n=1 Tax=Saguinus oedipus TaxID=9490 RepID=A0ABQ9VSQ8_SAGOE|nr:hypothetical protein P7K49_012162 [Saguinus oedipus]
MDRSVQGTGNSSHEGTSQGQKQEQCTGRSWTGADSEGFPSDVQEACARRVRKRMGTQGLLHSTPDKNWSPSLAPAKEP